MIGDIGQGRGGGPAGRWSHQTCRQAIFENRRRHLETFQKYEVTFILNDAKECFEVRIVHKGVKLHMNMVCGITHYYLFLT